jgi:hypothetical protein
LILSQRQRHQLRRLPNKVLLLLPDPILGECCGPYLCPITGPKLMAQRPNGEKQQGLHV